MWVTGVQTCALPIYLLFADDCIIFTQASERGAQRIVDILDTYLAGSGQLVNKAKSAVFFSGNCDVQTRHVVQRCLGIDKEALDEKYLGLPTALGRNISGPFEKLHAGAKNLTEGWCEKTLNAASREVLIKSVAQAIPTHSMSCFALSKTTCGKLSSVFARFWWGGNKEKRRIHWKRWPEVTQPKAQGGMGFKNLHLFNTAMLGKQGWRLLTNPDSLCARVLRGKYYHNSNFMLAKRKKNCSHTWRAILRGRSALELGSIKRIGDGSSTDIWLDRWIPGVFGHKPMCKKLDATASKVGDLINEDGVSWNSVADRKSVV